MSTRQEPSTEAVDDGKKATATDPDMMQIKVYSPYQVYFDEQAYSISAANDTGPFDILKGHHPFLTLVIPCELQIRAKKGEEKIKISRGVMYVKQDRVTVFLDV
jgi:F0F1-type ATP synthase epsilon subunit